MEKSISFLLNGEKRTVEVSPSEGLLGMLRDKIGVKSPKCGCDRGDCGTCSVMIDGRVVRSCLVLAIEVDGAALTTLEGLLENGDLNPLQKAFLNKNAFQCGFCAPGMIMSATELLKRNSQPTRDEIKEGLAGNLCRCTGYTPIIDAVLDLVSEQKKDRKQ
ncbi:MAG TPA: (2Fe-2S)-binding protein [Bdellovibrionales bacterium]|nr:MAG: (2Fe-2S)-binding protein [Bdellovibrionales bacterium GWB1_52_6]OFZ04612.1 MAG: (2Fe-2S)-binding protein [Bdellovibrionales bacterium GWA1_52_35]OFZ32806.1 MAG: (2Fe-2S)-binding protein [Bdellovibrionales bacterium GWC1_52_8]HAR44319.1 (2Fe-2S)-binding protein [Bdellovibrionales bacterium]HCM40008.1 (2Fe-2S)-binding protein [Bdellovibrionales bacterium]